MATNHEQLAAAYLDGELSAAEAAEFDNTLTPQEKAGLAAEMTFERAIGERLARGAACPDDLWNRTLAAAGGQAAPVVAFRPRRMWRYAVPALAAGLAIGVAGLLGLYAGVGGPSVLAMDKSTTIAKLQAQVELDGHDLESVNAFFKEHGFNIAMTKTEARAPGDHHHSRREMLGVRPTTNHGDDVMELMFECCGRPLKVVVAKAGSETAREIGEAMAAGQIQESRHVGDYVAALVGRHDSQGLLMVLTDPSAA